MADFNIDNLVKQGITEIINCKKFNTPEELWYSMTRQMFRNKPALEVIDLVYSAMEEAADTEWKNRSYPKWITESKSPQEKKMLVKGDLRKCLDTQLKITDVAIHYGLKVINNKSICPFHKDTDPSLSFNDDKNVFHCFGCHAKGSIITFIKMMEELKDAKK